MNPGLSMSQSIGEIPQGLGTVHVGRMLAIPGFKSEQNKPASNPPITVEQATDHFLSADAGQLIDSVLGVLNQLVVQAIEARTAAEFHTAFERVFPSYYDAVLGLSYLVQIVVPKDILDIMSDESFSKIEASFRDQGLAAFGSDVRDQALFTAWMLRKINDLCRRIDSISLQSDLKESNSELFRDFVYHAMCTRFSLDCLSKSMLLQKPIYPEVLPRIIEGLRHAVNAYAYARRALDLRDPLPKSPVTSVEWDDEDQELLDEASYDILEAIA